MLAARAGRPHLSNLCLSLNAAHHAAKIISKEFANVETNVTK